MATLHWPTPIFLPKRSLTSPTVPFIFLEDGSYASPINYCLQERAHGREVSDIKGVRVLEAVSPKTERAEAYAAFNFINFVEAVMSVPDAHCDSLWEVKNWHHLLWKELMASGHWTRAFFSTGRAEPLNLRQTIAPRFQFIKQAWKWMREEGLIGDYIEQLPRALILEKQRAITSHFEEQALSLFGTAKRISNYRKRQNPKTAHILSQRQIVALLNAANNIQTKLLLLLILFTGLRREEVEQNTLCPGHTFQRQHQHLLIDSPRFPRNSYLLSHSEADTMIGVLPSIDSAFRPDDEAREHCKYRVIGKGLKIRRISIPFRLMRLMWQHYLKGREKILQRAGKTTASGPASFFLNRYGEALSSNAITRIVNKTRLRAEKLIGEPIKCDVHTLRHTYACIYLEAVIIGSATRDGLRPDNLTLAQIERYGRGGLLILKENMGHNEYETTENYLKQLSTGKLGLQYQKLFDEAIDHFMVEAGNGWS